MKQVTHLEIEEEGLKIKIKKEKEVVAVSAVQPTVQTVQPVADLASPKAAEKLEAPACKKKRRYLSMFSYCWDLL